MGFIEPLSFIALLTVPVYFYFKIKQAYARKLPISSIFLWKRISDNPDKSKYQRKWLVNTAIILQILGLLLSVFAAAYPYFPGIASRYRNVIIVIDNSVSSSAKENNKAALSTLSEECVKLLDMLSSSDKVSIIANPAGIVPGTVLHIDKTPAQAKGILSELQVCEAPVPIDELIVQAQALKLRVKTRAIFVFTTQLPSEKYPDTTLITTPPNTNNLGIVSCSASKQEDQSYTLFAGCKNYSDKAIIARVSLETPDAQPPAPITKTFAPGTITPVIIPDLRLPVAKEISLKIETPDSIACDNLVTLFPAFRTDFEICIIGNGARYISKAFNSMPDTQLFTTQTMPETGAAASMDLLVFYRFIPEKFPDNIPAIVIDPPKQFYPFNFSAKISEQTFIYSSDISLLKNALAENEKITFRRYLNLSIAEPEKGNVTEIARAGQYPAICLYEKGPEKILLLAFDPEWRPDGWETDWASNKASFPVFWARVMEKLMPISPREKYAVFAAGTRIPLPYGPSVKITGPSGAAVLKPGPDGNMHFTPYKTGIYNILDADTGRKYAVSAALLTDKAIPDNRAATHKEFLDSDLSPLQEYHGKTPESVTIPLILLSIALLLAGWKLENL
ncbi:MAG: BatA domain-containing protein [Planctomycetes bacterium]|nr:BatA domain-containing protein [Planctomycetota bacterium]